MANFVVGEKAIYIDGHEHWLYAVIDPATSDLLHVRLFPSTVTQTTRWFLVELHRRYQCDGITFLVEYTDHLVEVLDADRYDFDLVRHGPRDSIESINFEV